MNLSCIPLELSERMFEIVKWLTPVVLFFFGYLLKWFVTKWSKYNRRKTHRSYIFNTVESLIKKEKTQVLEIKKCIERLKEITETDTIIAKVTGKETESLRHIKPHDYYEIFFLKAKGNLSQKEKNYRDFIKNIGFIDEFSEALFSYNRDVFQRLQLQYQEFNKGYVSLVEFQNNFIDYNNSQSINTQEDAFLMEIIVRIKRIFERFGNTIDDINVVYTEIIQPLVEHSKKFSGDRRASILIKPLMISKLAYLTIEQERKQHLKILEERENELSETIDSLTGSIVTFKNYKYRFF